MVTGRSSFDIKTGMAQSELKNIAELAPGLNTSNARHRKKHHTASAANVRTVVFAVETRTISEIGQSGETIYFYSKAHQL